MRIVILISGIILIMFSCATCYGQLASGSTDFVPPVPIPATISNSIASLPTLPTLPILPTLPTTQIASLTPIPAPTTQTTTLGTTSSTIVIPEFHNQLIQAEIQDLQMQANTGNIDAQYALGVRYLYGMGVVPDIFQAATLLREVAGKVISETIRVIGGCPTDSRPPQELFFAANFGDLRAQYAIGNMFFTGTNVPLDYLRAATIFLDVANFKFNPSARRNFGIDFSIYPLSTLRKAAETGDLRAWFALGNRYFFGDGVQKNYFDAAQSYFKVAVKNAAWYRTITNSRYDTTPIDQLKQLAEKGDIDAQYHIGKRYLFGKDVPKDYFEAAKWLRAASIEIGYSGIPVYYQRLSSFYHPSGFVEEEPSSVPPGFAGYAKPEQPSNKHFLLPGLPQDPASGSWIVPIAPPTLSWFYSPYFLGIPPLYGDLLISSYDLLNLRRMADAGNITAQLDLASRYFFGYGVERNIDEAKKYYTMAASAGNPLASYMLVQINNSQILPRPMWDYSTNNFVTPPYIGYNQYPPSFITPVQPVFNEAWYLEEAKKENPNAQFVIGVQYHLKKDYPQAIFWLRKSSQNGNFLAQYTLAHILWNNNQNDKDIFEAEKLFEFVARKGSCIAKGMLVIMYALGDKQKVNLTRAKAWLALALSPSEYNPDVDYAIINDMWVSKIVSDVKVLAWLSYLAKRPDCFRESTLRQTIEIISKRISDQDRETAEKLKTELTQKLPHIKQLKSKAQKQHKTKKAKKVKNKTKK